jgi:hypothetical protein
MRRRLRCCGYLEDAADEALVLYLSHPCPDVAFFAPLPISTPKLLPLGLEVPKTVNMPIRLAI